MIVYIVMLTVTITILYIAEKSSNLQLKHIFYFLAVIPFIFVSAIRYDVGTDYFFRYVPDYNYIASGGDIDNLESGFKLLIKFCIFFSKKPQILFVITSVLINFFVFYVIYKVSKNVMLSIIILFFNGFFFSSLNIVRQCLAISIIFIGYTFLIKEDNKIKNKIIYMIFVLIAYSIHKSSIITASFLFFTKKNIMNWKWVFAVTIIIFLLGEKMVVTFKELLQNTKYSVYFLDKFIESDVSIIYLIENVIVYVLMNIQYYYDKKNNKVNKEEIVLLNIEGLCLLIISLAKCHVVFDRLALYCLSFQILSVPFFLNKIKKEGISKGKFARKKYIGMMTLFIIMFMTIFFKTNILNNNGEVVPYKTIFNKNS